MKVDVDKLKERQSNRFKNSYVHFKCPHCARKQCISIDFVLEQNLKDGYDLGFIDCDCGEKISFQVNFNFSVEIFRSKQK